MLKDTLILAADTAARKAAGLENRPGRYRFPCPVCGASCTGRWTTYHGQLHGRTGCCRCGIWFCI